MKITLIFLLLCSSSFSAWEDEKSKIEFLIEQVKTSELTFIRNGDEHNAQKAYEHLKMKYKNALNSWFTPPKSKWTVELFIKEVASKSSWSGKPYKIKRKDGKTVLAEIWFKEKLKLYKN